jgi:predicted dehydrogenase
MGTGGIGSYHVRLWRDVHDAEVVGVYDVDPLAAKRVAEEFGVTRVYSSMEDALDGPEADAVDICTPNNAHKACVLAALGAGKHCLCEKPLAATAGEIEEMIAARDRSGKLLMTTQHLRFEPSAQALKRLVAAGRLGEIYHTRAWWLRRRLAPTSPGLLTRALAGRGPGLDIGVHMLDLALYLLEYPRVLSVSGYSTQRLAKQPGIANQWGEYRPEDFEVEDLAAGFIRVAGGGLLTLEVSWLLNMVEHEWRALWLHGTEGGARWPDLNLSHVQEGLLVDAHVSSSLTGNGHRLAFQAFCEAIRSGGPSPVPAEQSLAVATVLEALYASAEAGREVALV